MINALFVLCLSVWVFYEGRKRKSSKLEILSFILITIELRKWPLFLSVELAYACLGLGGAVWAFFRFWKTKNQDVLSLAILLLLIGIVLLVLGLQGFFLTPAAVQAATHH